MLSESQLRERQRIPRLPQDFVPCYRLNPKPALIAAAQCEGLGGVSFPPEPAHGGATLVPVSLAPMSAGGDVARPSPMPDDGRSPAREWSAPGAANSILRMTVVDVEVRGRSPPWSQSPSVFMSNHAESWPTATSCWGVVASGHRRSLSRRWRHAAPRADPERARLRIHSIATPPAARRSDGAAVEFATGLN